MKITNDIDPVSLEADIINRTNKGPLFDAGVITLRGASEPSVEGACEHADQNCWSLDDILKVGRHFGTANEAAARLCSGYWQAIDAEITIASIRGVLALPQLSNHTSGIERLVEMFVILEGLRSDYLHAVMVHSAVEAYLRNRDLIDYLPHSDGRMVAVFQGRRVVTSDQCPVESGVYTTYALGKAFIKRQEPMLDPVIGGYGTLGLELSRDPMGGNLLINRRKYQLHPRGFRWTGKAVELAYPTTQEIANGANWELEVPESDVAIYAVKHRID